jgi:hypothetical protein
MDAKRGLKDFIDEWRRERPDLDPTVFGITAAIKQIDLQTEAEFRRLSADFGIGPGDLRVLFALRRSGVANPRGRQIYFNRCWSLLARSPSRRIDSRRKNWWSGCRIPPIVRGPIRRRRHLVVPRVSFSKPEEFGSDAGRFNAHYGKKPGALRRLGPFARNLLLIAPAGLLSGVPGGVGNVSRIGRRVPDQAGQHVNFSVARRRARL